MRRSIRLLNSVTSGSMYFATVMVCRTLAFKAVDQASGESCEIDPAATDEISGTRMTPANVKRCEEAPSKA